MWITPSFAASVTATSVSFTPTTVALPTDSLPLARNDLSVSVGNDVGFSRTLMAGGAAGGGRYRSKSI